MAGAMRKMGVYLGLIEDQDRYDEYDERYDAYDDASEAEEAAPERERDERGSRAPERRAPAYAATGAERPERPERGGVATLPERRPERQPERHAERRSERHPGPALPADSPRITTLHPRTYNEARTIGEHFRDGTPVIMNLSEMDDGDAKRLVDFAAGLVFGTRGTIERVTSKVFLLSPADVHVTAEDKARMAERGFFNQS